MPQKPSYEDLEKKLKRFEQAEFERLQAARENPTTQKLDSSILHHIHEAVVVHSADTKIIASNSKAQELLGLTEAQMLGKKAIDKRWQFFNSDNKKLPLDQYPVNQVLSTRQVLRHFIFSIYRPGTADKVWVLVNADPVFNEKRKIEQVIISFMDITKLKDAEYEREQSLSLLKAALESTADGILVVNRNGLWSNFNQKFLDIWKIPPRLHEKGNDKEVLDYVINTIVDPEGFMTKVQELYQNPEAYSFDTILLKDGRSLERYSQPQWLNDEIAGRVWSFREITERKVAEEALRESEAKYKEFVEGTDDLVTRVDNEGTFLYVNHISEGIFGVTPEKIVGMSAFDFVPPDDQENTRIWFNECIDKKRLKVSFENRHLNQKTGKISHLLWTSNFKYNKAGRLIGINGIGHDITDRKLVEEALRENVGLYKGLFKNNHSVMLLIDPGSLEIVDANPAATSYYGWSHEELTKKKITDINIFSKEKVIQGIRQAKDGKRKHFFSTHRLSNGDIRDVEVYSGFIAVRGRALLYSIIHDITERKLIEVQLRESEERFKSLLEFIPGVSIQGYTTDGIVHYWNKASEGIYGYSAEEAIGKYLGDLIIPPEFKALFKQGLEIGSKAIRSGELIPAGEVMLLHKGGHLVPVYSIHTVVCLEGKTPMMFCLDLDLSERKQAELLLQEREEKLRSIIEHANEFFYVHNTDHEITYISPASEEILGYTPQEMMTSWTNLTTDNPINQKGVEITEKAFTTGQRQDPYYLELKKKDGNHVMVEINESPIKDSQGNVLGITGAGKDVTERVRNEQALKDAHDKLELRVDERTKELSKTNEKLLREIRERKEAEESLRAKEKELRRQTDRLAETNTALKVLLEHRGEEKTLLEENILSNVDKLAMPYLDKLATYIPSGHAKTYLDIIKTNLKDLVSPFAGTLSSKHLNLTPAEMQLSDFIRNGLTNKEIVSQLNVSIETVRFHRKNIRKKLGLTNKKTNLRSYLQRLTD